jgi:hypothetical protein
VGSSTVPESSKQLLSRFRCLNRDSAPFNYAREGFKIEYLYLIASDSIDFTPCGLKAFASMFDLCIPGLRSCILTEFAGYGIEAGSCGSIVIYRTGQVEQSRASIALRFVA